MTSHKIQRRWWKIDANLVDEYSVQKFAPDEFIRKFYAALNGEINEFSPFVKEGRGRPSAVYASLRRRIFERDDFTCQYCGERGKRLECDHKIPVSRGGSDHHSNLITACFSCNRSKRAKTVEEWLHG